MFFLNQTDENIKLACGRVQIILGEFTPQGFDLVPDLFPTALKMNFVHRLDFQNGL
jgi:hypothetical protein